MRIKLIVYIVPSLPCTNSCYILCGIVTHAVKPGHINQNSVIDIRRERRGHMASGTNRKMDLMAGQDPNGLLKFWFVHWLDNTKWLCPRRSRPESISVWLENSVRKRRRTSSPCLVTDIDSAMAR